MKHLFSMLLLLIAANSVGQNIEYLIDFGPDDVTNGNQTLSPDANGNYWNNVIDPLASGSAISLVDKSNNSSTAFIQVTQDFLANGILNGGLLSPDPVLLGEFAIATATQDYFFVTGTGSLEVGGLTPGNPFVFSLFGTRNTASTRISQYDLMGANSYMGTLQTSGTAIGAGGYNGNNDNVLVSDTVFADAAGKITLDLSVVQGGFAYLSFMKVTEIIPSAVNQAPLVDAGADFVFPGGTTTITLNGSAFDPDGDPLTVAWSQLSGPAVPISSPSNDTTMITGMADGATYSFELSADDGEFIVRDTATISVSSDIQRSFLIDFGPDDVTNGNITTSPDPNGNTWNNLTTPNTSGSPVDLVDLNNAVSGYSVKVASDLLSNGIQNGGLLSPEDSLLGDLAIPTATQDYFFTVSTGTLSFENLDPTKGYIFRLFGSRNTNIVRRSLYEVKGSNTVLDSLQSSGPDLGGTGYDGNNSTTTLTGPVFPNANGRITLKVSVLEGGFAYLNMLQMDEVDGSTRYFLDFGPDDVTNGNQTGSPDLNSNFWNNQIASITSTDSLLLSDSKNSTTGIYVSVTQDFSSNGILNGGLLSPEDSLLGNLAIATATQDYFFTTATGSLEFGGMDTSKGYVFTLFGTRNSPASRVTEYVFSGKNSFTDSLQTSGVDLGGAGYNGNNSSVVVTDTLFPAADGTMTLDVSVAEGGFAYLGCMTFEEIRIPAEPEPLCADKDSFKIAYMGSSVAFGVGATNNQGYAFNYTGLLDDRAQAGDGYDWSTVNISIGGNNTVDLLNRWEGDLLPECSRYVMYGLSLGNENITGQGQAAFDQFRDNMLQLIDQARQEGIEPVVVNCYTRADFDATDYQFIKDMNLLIHSWDVASINVLGAIDDGAGRWANGFEADPFHPNTAGHQEFFYSMVPSLFDALHDGKPQPTIATSTGITFDKSSSAQQIEFTPDATVHPFTYSFEVKTSESGVLAGFSTDNGGYGGLVIDEATGAVTYDANAGASIQGSAIVNDDNWHRVTLSHYYAWGKTFLYVDGVLQGELDETLEPDTYVLGEENAPSASYRNLFFYRSAMNAEEITALNNGDMLKSSLEFYCPLDGASGSDSLINLAQSTNEIQVVDDYQVVTDLDIQPDQIPVRIFPNPVREAATIEFSLQSATKVSMAIFDITGRKVVDLASQQFLPAGTHAIEWDITNSSSFPEGIYLCVIQTGQTSTSKRVYLQQ